MVPFFRPSDPACLAFYAPRQEWTSTWPLCYDGCASRARVASRWPLEPMGLGGGPNMNFFLSFNSPLLRIERQRKGCGPTHSPYPGAPPHTVPTRQPPPPPDRSPARNDSPAVGAMLKGVAGAGRPLPVVDGLEMATTPRPAPAPRRCRCRAGNCGPPRASWGFRHQFCRVGYQRQEKMHEMNGP